MTATLLSLAIAALVGWPIARSLTPHGNRVSIAGRAFLLGLAGIALCLFALSSIPLGWTRAAVGLTLLIISAVFIRGRKSWRSLEPISRSTLAALLVATLLIGPLIGGHALFAALAPPADVDFLENWGWKGKSFFHHGGVDWELLRGETVLENHSDYPILLPLLFAFIAIVNGGWSDATLGMVSTGVAVALLLVLTGDALQHLPDRRVWPISLILLIVTPIVLVPWTGLAEAPFIAFATAGLLAIRTGLRDGNAAETRLGAVLLGCASLTKNEGITLIVAALIAALIAGRAHRAQILQLWPALLLMMVWTVPQRLAGLRVDLFDSGPLDRLINGVRNWDLLAAAFYDHAPGRPLFWAGLGAMFIFVLPQLARRERFMLIVITLQALAYLLAYMVTPHDVSWHVQWSLERVLRHLSVPLTYVVLLTGTHWAVGRLRTLDENLRTEFVSKEDD
jgi:hypothetical protein